MEFDKLRYKSPLVRGKVADVIKLCEGIKTGGPRAMSAEQIEAVVGQGETGRILRSVLRKEKNAASKRGIPATWNVDQEAYSELRATTKRLAQRKRMTLEEVVQLQTQK